MMTNDLWAHSLPIDATASGSLGLKLPHLYNRRGLHLSGRLHQHLTVSLEISW